MSSPNEPHLENTVALQNILPSIMEKLNQLLHQNNRNQSPHQSGIGEKKILDQEKEIVITGFAGSIETKILLAALAKLGDPVRVVIPKYNNSSYRGHAFILFDKEEEARSAVKLSKHFEIGGNKVSIDYVRNMKDLQQDADRNKARSQSDKFRRFNIMDGRSRQYRHNLVSNEKIIMGFPGNLKADILFEFIANFGDPTYIINPKWENSIYRGFCFVYFGKQEEAVNAVRLSSRSNLTIGGIPVEIEYFERTNQSNDKKVNRKRVHSQSDKAPKTWKRARSQSDKKPKPWKSFYTKKSR